MPDVVNIAYRFSSDRTATNAVVRDNQRIESSVEDIQRATRLSTDAYTQQEQAAERVARASREMHEAQIKLAREQSELYGDTASRLSAFSGLASNISGATGGRLMLAADILDAVEAAKLMSAELPALTSQFGLTTKSMLALGGAGGALALLGLAFKKFSDDRENDKRALEEARKVYQGYFDLVMELNLFLQTATSEDIQNRLTESERTLAAAQATQAEIDTQSQEIFNSLAKVAESLAIPIPKDAEATPELLEAILEQFEKAGVTAPEIRAQIEELVRAQEQLDEIYADTSSEAEKLSAKLIPAGDGLVKVGEDVEFALGRFGRIGTNLAQRVLPDLTNEYERQQEAANELKQKLADSLGSALAVAGRARSAVAGIPSNVKEGATLFAQLEQAELKARAETDAAITQAITDYNADRLKLIDTFEAAQVEREQKYTEQIANLRTEHDDTLTSIREDFEKAEKDAERDYYRDKERRERQHRNSLLDAAAHLDAEAVQQENDRYDEESKEAEDAFKEEQRQRAEQQRERLRDEDRAFNERLRQAQRAYQDQNREQAAALQAQLRDLRSKHIAELGEIRNAGAQKLTDLRRQHEDQLRELNGFLMQETMLKQKHYEAYLSWLRQSQQISKDEQMLRDAGITILKPAARPTLPTFAAGGYTPGGPIMSHSGEWVADRRTTSMLERGIGAPLTQQNVQRIINSRTVGDITVPITIGNAGNYSLAQIKRVVVDAVVEAVG